MSLRIVNKTKLLKQVRKAATDALKPYISKALPKIRKKIRNRVIAYFKRHPVIRGLAGRYPGDENRDLQAIFGFTDTESVQAVQEILRVVEESIQVTSIKRGNSYQFFIKTDSDLLNKIESISAGSYDYEQRVFDGVGKKRRLRTNDVTIPWMEWLLNGANVEANLTFDLDPKQMEMSRTKRAIMEDRGSGDWEFESKADFITEIGTNPKLIEEAEAIFVREIQKVLDR